MTNKYLEKIAKEQTKDEVGLVPLGAGLLAAKASVPRLLGYHKVYHGTSVEKANKILREGFDPARGGSGAAKGHRGFERQSAGKVHVTKSPIISRMFAAFTERGEPLTSQKQMKQALKDSLVFKGKTLTARIPESYWNAMRPDPDMGSVKDTAATFHHKIDPKYVSRAGGVGGVLPHLSPRHLLKYYKANPKRALTGLGLAAGGSALAGTQLSKLLPGQANG